MLECLSLPLWSKFCSHILMYFMYLFIYFSIYLFIFLFIYSFIYFFAVIVVSTILLWTVTDSFRTVMFNEGTSIYQLTKNLVKILSPLTKSECKVDSAKSFINKMKNVKVPINYLTSNTFSLMYVWIERFILFFKGIFIDREIERSVSRGDM